MAYTPTYIGTDLDDLFIDLIATVLAVFIANVILLVTLLILGIVALRSKQILDAIFGLVR